MTESDLAALDQLIARGRFANRSDALRAGLRRLLHEEREEAIDDAYRKGYADHPQEEWVAEIGLAGLAAFDRDEGGEPL